MLKKARHWHSPLFACEIAGCRAVRASNSDLPPGWGLRVMAGYVEALLCTGHRRAYDADDGIKNLPLKDVYERAKFVG